MAAPLIEVSPATAKGIRRCERGDLPQVVALYERVMRSGTSVPASRLAEYFERTFFDCPWADVEIPSLVYENARGKIVGFLGSHTRRLRLDGRRIRLACGGQFVVEPEARASGVGAFLFRTFLGGQQDISITDGATETVRRMWATAGGETAPLKSILWTRALRPIRFGGDYVLERLQRPALARVLRPMWRVMERFVPGAVGKRLRPARPQTSEELLTPRAVLDMAPLVTESARCYPDYDEPFLNWLFYEMAQVKTRGTVVCALVRDNGGQAIGWYVYYLQEGVSEVMHIASKRRAYGDVLDNLLYHAYVNGSAAVRGRLEPQLLAPLSDRRCIFTYNGSALMHAKAPATLGALLSSQCLLARMDGEAWMGHHTEPFA